MSTLTTTAPACFAAKGLFGLRGQPGVQFLAVGLPNLTRILPKATKVDWNALSTMGAPAALEVGNGTYVEVRAFRGAFYSDSSWQQGRTKAYAAGAFLFPVRRPLVLGVFKCYQEYDLHDEDVHVQKKTLRIASVGRRGVLAGFDQEMGRAGHVAQAGYESFVNCLAVAAARKDDDPLKKALYSITGVADQAKYGVRRVMRAIFASGKHPVKFEGQMRWYTPESMSDGGYDPAVPMMTMDEAMHPRYDTIGYSMQRSRFMYLNS